MKKWRYSVSSNSIWASWDYGEVEAETYEEARKKAIQKLTQDFEKVNIILAIGGGTEGFSIDCDFHGVEVEEI